MRKNILTCVAVVTLAWTSTNAFAQFDLGKLVKSGVNAVSKSASTSDLVSGLTSVFSSKKVATVEDLVGSWTYTEPAVVFTSGNLLKSAGGKMASATIEKNLQTQLSKVGITKGKLKMNFTKDGKFTQTVAGKTLKGTFTVNGKSVVLKYAGQVKQVIGTTQVDGNNLLIVMDVSKLLGYMKTLGALSGNQSLKTATSLLGSMDGMLCGLRLNKE